jgi:hypothetical protein
MSQAMQLWMVPSAEVPVPDIHILRRLLGLLDVNGVSLVGVYEHDADWDTNNRIILSATSVTVERYLEVVAQHGDDCVLAQVDGRLDSFGRSLRSRFPAATDYWEPCTGMLTIGPHSHPDLEWEETIWHGNVSLGIYGNGIGLVQPLREILSHDVEWQQMLAEVGELLGSPMRTEFTIDY